MITAITQTGSASSVRMLTPNGYLGTESDHLFLVGKTSAERVEIFINKVKRYETSTVDSLFHIYVTFGYGLNEIVVRPMCEDTVMREELAARLEVLSSPYSTGRLQKIYPEYKFHASVQEAECRSCHRGQIELEMADSGQSTCVECHRDFEGRTLLHTNLTREACATCHNRETNQVEQSSGGIVSNPCYSCHSDKIEKFDRQYIHGPVAGGSCAVCHDPHGSKFEHSLISAQEVLCFSCHEFNREFKELPIQHKPFRDGNCDACHDPHATSNRWVLAKSSEELCLECHSPEEEPFKNHIHPYNVKPKKRKSSVVQLSESGTLECISCHNPHASQTKHLLRSNQKNTCLGCHADKS